MKNWKEAVVTIFISGIIGAMVGLPIIIIETKSVFNYYLLFSAIAGMVIGILSRWLFMFFYRNLKENAFFAFTAIIIINGLCTFLITYLFGVRNILYYIFLIGIAQLLGNSFAFMMYRYNIKLNEKLKETQEKFKG